MAQYIITIDASDLISKVNFLRSRLTPERANTVLRWACSNTARRVKPILKKEIPKEYYATPSWIGSNVKGMQMSSGGGGINCVIPIIGKKGTVGGRFDASGGRRGWVPKGARYTITARIVKGETSRLPAVMSSYGGQPPFRNLGSAKLGGVAFTRSGRSVFPIERIAAIGVPQMPMNRARPEVESQVHDELEKQLDRFIGYLI